MHTTAKHRAPMGSPTVMAEAIARTLAPSPGSGTDIVVRHLDAVVTLHGKHAADPTPTGRVLNVAAFRSLTSEIEVAR